MLYLHLQSSSLQHVRSVKRCMDANISLQISMSARFMQMSKLISLPFLFFNDKSNRKSRYHAGGQSKALFLLAEDASRCDGSFVDVLQTDACAFTVCLLQKSQWQEWIFKSFWFPRENKFVFQLVPTGTPMKVPMFTRLQKRSRRLQEETSPLVSQTHWSGLTKTKILACDVFFFVFLSGFVSASLSFSTLTVESTSPAKLESSCQSKQYFYENIVHIMTMSMMHCTFLI